MIETAQIIAVGDEVLWGETVNTNAAWMAQFLMRFGIRPEFQCVVPDQESAIGEALIRALRVADLVVIIGGLGPTADDRTLDAVSQALGVALDVHPQVLEHISGRHSRQVGWEASIHRQSRVLRGAEVWLNFRGQAPGQVMAAGSSDRWVALLPGPPSEMKGLAEAGMAEWLSPRARSRIHRDTYSIFDLGESAVAAHLAPLLQGQHPQTGIYAQPGRVDVRIETPDTPEGRIQRERSRAWVLTHVPVPVYVLGDTSREAYLIQWLQDRQMTVAAMESLTGGLLLSTLIANPGASASVLGGAVAYTDPVKRMFGVPSEVLETHGAVSAPCAEAMAEAARHYFGADVGIATTGFAGPDGGTASDPAGTFYVGCAGPGGTVSHRRYTPLDRQAVRQMAVQTAMSAVWEVLKLPILL